MRKLRRGYRKNAQKRKKFKNRAIAAGTAAAITLAAGVGFNKAYAAHTPDRHELPVAQDADADLLADSEEVAIGYSVVEADQNRNMIPDGVDLAKRCAAVINQLPWHEQAKPGETYKWHAGQFGLETCDICGATVNMGPAGIINPKLGISVDCPLIAIHYMEHGSFSYAGDVHGTGRVNVPLLLQTLELRFPYEPDEHQLPVGGTDSDGDLLTDSEELATGFNPNDPDQDNNLIPDGIDLAKQCSELLDGLPVYELNPPGVDELYKVNRLQKGLEYCDVCAQTVNMGYWLVINPTLGLSIEVPEIVWHYMRHGSFSYSGDVHGKGRIDVVLLFRILGIPERHQLPVRDDADGDLLINKEESAIGYDAFNADQNGNQIADGVELAKRCATVINDLPRQGEAGPDETYRICHELDGLEQCDVCGRWIHMGGCAIVNPQLGLQYPANDDPLEGMFLPDLAVHYMEHGSFDCLGSEHKGRVELQRLMRVLELRFPHDPNEHQLPLDHTGHTPMFEHPVKQLAPDANDLDGDLLADSEELEAGFNLYDPDQDNDITPDGIELAKQCKVAIDQLPEFLPGEMAAGIEEPYRILHRTRGIESCEICGYTIAMDYWEVVNPRLGLTIEYLPVMSAHYMEHGSFSYAATVHSGRVDVALLLKILEMPRCCGDLGTMYLPGDLNKDCRVNFGDFARFADKWLDNTEPGQE